MVKALIIGVSKYPNPLMNNLPLCYNDIYAMQEALILGLSVKSDNILLLGESKMVNVEDFNIAISKIVKDISDSDTCIIYFSGHGYKYKSDDKNYLVFSDGLMSVDNLVSKIDEIYCRNKIVMLDSCHSGNKETSFGSPIDLNQTADKFVGHGCTIMASCDLDESCGFNNQRKISLYTSILYDGLTANFLTKKGKKSLEDIKEYVDRRVSIANANKLLLNKQHNAFRSNIVGTIYFDVKEYIPYESEKIYKETDKYIIYSVEPTHANVKRISLKVILRFACAVEDLASIAEKINRESLYYDVFNNSISENRFKGCPNNIIFAYYGYDEDDLINNNYAFRSIWIDNNKNKNNWYITTDHSSVINDIWIEENKNYGFLKKFISNNISDDGTLKVKTRNCMYEMIINAEKFIMYYREYINRTITENDFIRNTEDLSAKIRKLYLEQADLPIATKNLYEWANAYSNLACAIDDFVVIWQDRNRDDNNKVQMMNLTIKRYDECLEKIKELDLILAKQIDD